MAIDGEPDETNPAGEGTSQSASPQETSSGMASPSAAPDEFRSFLVALATDPAKLGAFIKDPDGAMGAANIDPVDQVILKGAQAWMIHARLLGQKFSFTPPATPTVLVVDMVGAAAAGAADQPTVRSGSAFPAPPSQGSLNMFPSFPPVQVPLQLVVHPQFPQAFPQFPQAFPQFPQAFPQIFPQVHPQVVVHPQIFPQIFPQVHPQVVVHPQIFPQVHPQLVVQPQIFPQIFPQIHPQLVFPTPNG